jgi:hypothetical protein
MLREFAKEELGAQRCSEDYLEALGYVIGNHAFADRIGTQIEMNRGVEFASEGTMKTIIKQFQKAKIVYRRPKRNAAGYAPNVTFYQGLSSMTDPEDEYTRIQREQDEEDYRGMLILPKLEQSGTRAEEVPY